MWIAHLCQRCFLSAEVSQAFSWIERTDWNPLPIWEMMTSHLSTPMLVTLFPSSPPAQQYHNIQTQAYLPRSSALLLSQAACPFWVPPSPCLFQRCTFKLFALASPSVPVYPWHLLFHPQLPLLTFPPWDPDHISSESYRQG